MVLVVEVEALVFAISSSGTQILGSLPAAKKIQCSPAGVMVRYFAGSRPQIRAGRTYPTRFGSS